MQQNVKNKTMKGIQNTSTNNYSTIIGNNKKFMVPKFQRDYSWTRNNGMTYGKMWRL